MRLRKLLLFCFVAIPALGQTPPNRPPCRFAEPMKGKSRPIARDDLELLTFATEADVQQL